jgi:FK506-binding protein 1
MPETLQKEVIVEGNGTDKPKAGDTVTMDYTGWLYEANQPRNRGKVCVSERPFGSDNADK